MRNINKLVAFFLLVIVFSGCQLLKSEDKKIEELLVGRFYEDDETLEDGTKFKDSYSEFYKDGKFQGTATLEFYSEEDFDITEIKFKFTGSWEVKDKFIYYKYEKITSEPEMWASMVAEEINKKNTPDKVIEYDAAKIIYENSDGERRTMKKSY
jgi:hypothetical protein